MEINTNNQVQGLETAAKASTVKREREDGPGRKAAEPEENPGDRISLSAASKKAVSELTGPQAAAQSTGKAALSEEEADHLARQASEQLAQTNAAISNQAIQKAVDLFT